MVDSASNRNEYQVYFLGGRCVRLTTLPPSCAVVMKSGNLNFLEPSGPLQACNGTALPFFYIYRSILCKVAKEVVREVMEWIELAHDRKGALWSW